MYKNKIVPFLLSIIILLLSISIVSHNNTATKEVSNMVETNTEEMLKGIWVSYITLDMQNTDNSEQVFKDKITSIIKKSKESGFNTLIFQVRPFCDALYNSKYFPWSHILTSEQGKNPHYDPLKIICEMCHENNIKVHAWINPYRVSSQKNPQNFSDNNPYVKDKEIGFEHKGNIYLDPSNEKAINLIVNGVKEIVLNYDVDGIQFDDYFYPEGSDSIDDKEYNIYSQGTVNPISKEMWRAKNVNILVKKVYSAVHKYSDDVIFGISPQGNLNNNLKLGADVKTWCKTEGYIDYICPQIYFSLDNPALTFEESLTEWQKIKHHENLSVYIGLAGYKGGTDEDEGTWLDNNDILKNEIKICENKKVDGIMLYSYECFNNDKNKAEISNVINYMTGIKA